MKRMNWSDLSDKQQKVALSLAKAEAQIGGSAVRKAAQIGLAQNGIQKSANGWVSAKGAK